MFNLDIPTLRVVALFLVLGTLAALLVFWKNHKFKAQTTLWIAGIVTYSVPFVLVLVRDNTVSLAFNLGIDLSKFASNLFFLYAIRKGQGRNTSLLPGIAFFIGLGAASWYFNYVSSNMEARMILIAFAAVLMSAVSAWTLWRSPRFRWRSPESAALVIFVLFAILNASRVVYLGTAETIVYDYLTVAFYSSAFFVSALSFVLILMGHSQLEEDFAQLMVRDKRENAAKLQSVETRWLIALEYSNAGAWELHRDTNMITLTSQWAKMLGYEQQERTITLREFLQYVHPEDWSKLLRQRQRVEDGVSHIVNTEHRLKGSNGNWIWVYSRGQNISTPGTNDFNKIIGIDMDITENKINQNKLEQAIAESKQATSIAIKANKAKSSFLANVSHEIRTPMNAILGFSQLLVDDHTLAPLQRENLEIINNSAQHLLTLIDDILNLSRIDSGHYKIDNKKLDPVALFGEIAKYFEKKPLKAEVAFEVNISEQLPSIIEADPKAIRQICINLLTNAFKFTNQGRITFKVDIVRTKDQDAVLLIDVYDTGIGVSAEDQQIIFDAFEQSESAQAIGEGYGLGLSICKNLVSLFGGDISLSSELNKGSCFTIRLPVQIIAENKLLQRPTPSGKNMVYPGMAGLKVLIVDDIESNRKLLRRFLANSGMDIHEASSAHAALTEITSWKPGLVLMDIRMPSMSGDDAIIALRNNAEFAHLPIIAVTANAMEGEKERLIKIGASDFISKPFLKDEIFKKIAAALELSPVRTETHVEAAPVAVRPAAAIPVEPPPAPAADEPTGTVRQRDELSILVVDDNRANQHLLYSQLKSLGLKADIASDGKIGLDLWHRKHHDIVFTDCSMPVMNGFDMTRSIRKLEASNDEPTQPGTKAALIIAVTGSPEEFKDKCKAAGMDDILGKPLLLQSLNQMLVKHQAIA
jgi:PAS domain S-box-containing protein